MDNKKGNGDLHDYVSSLEAKFYNDWITRTCDEEDEQEMPPEMVELFAEWAAAHAARAKDWDFGMPAEATHWGRWKDDADGHFRWAWLRGPRLAEWSNPMAPGLSFVAWKNARHPILGYVPSLCDTGQCDCATREAAMARRESST